MKDKINVEEFLESISSGTCINAKPKVLETNACGGLFPVVMGQGIFGKLQPVSLPLIREDAPTFKIDYLLCNTENGE